MAYKKREPMDNLEYMDLIRQTAMRVLLPEQTVRMVLEAVLETAREGLDDRKRVIFRDFGTIRPMIRQNRKCGTYVVVVFRASASLKERVKELVHERKRRGNDQVRVR